MPLSVENFQKQSKQKNTISVKTLVTDALCVTFALMLSYVETFLPPLFFIPGAKLGLANLAVMFCVIRCGFWHGTMVNLGRVLLSFLLFGQVSSLFFSLSGAFCTLCFLFFAARAFDHHIGCLGLSVGSAAFHQLGQLAATALLYAPLTALSFGAWMMVAAMITGSVNGILLWLLLRYTSRLPLGSSY